MNSHRRSLNTTRAKLYSPDTAESFLIDYRKIIDIGYFDQRQDFFNDTLDLINNDSLKAGNVENLFYTYFICTEFIIHDENLLSLFLIHDSFFSLCDFLKHNLKYTLESNDSDRGLYEAISSHAEDRSTAFKSLVCRLIMKKTKDWPAHHDFKDRIDLIKDIISPFEKLLDAKSKCQTENMRHRIGQTINRPRMTDGVLAVYDGLKANLLRYKNTSAGDLNKIVDKMPDVDFKCWLDEVGRCLNDFCRFIIESKQQLDLSVLQKYSDMCFFYYTELKELAETDDEIPFYMAPTEMVNSPPKKVEHHKKTKEIVYDDVGLHRIKTISTEPQDPNMPDNAKMKDKKNEKIIRDQKERYVRGSKTPGARSLAHEGFNGLFPRVGGQQSLNEKTLPLKLQMIDGSHNHMQDRKDEKTYFRVKTMQDGVRLSVATITRSSNKDSSPISVGRTSSAMSNRLDRKASNVRINKRLADESPVASPLKKTGFVKYHNGNANLDDDPDNYFDQETENDPLALIKIKSNPGSKDLSAPLSQIRLWSDSEKELQYGNSNFQISLTTNDKNNQKPEDQGVSIEEFQKGLPETATNNFFSNKLPEILETLNDQEDDDSEEYFNEFDGRLEISKPIRSIPALEVELSHHSIQDVEIPFQKIEKVPEIFIFKRHEKTNESAFMSCPPGFSGPEFGTSNASINKPIFNHPERLTLPLGSPSSRHERVFNIDNTGVRSSLDTPPSCKVSRPDKSSSFGGRTHSLKSSHTFTPTNRYSHARQINKDDISSEDCIGDKNEECAESYGSEDFHTALELDEQPSEFDLVCHMSDSSEQSGMIKLRHTSLLKNGAVEMKKLAHVFYQGEKPSGFNPQFTNGRVLFQNSMLALKITNASLSSFGNAFYSGATSRKEKVIIFDVNLENVGESTIIVFSATPKDPNGIKLECEQGPWTEK